MIVITLSVINIKLGSDNNENLMIIKLILFGQFILYLFSKRQSTPGVY